MSQKIISIIGPSDCGKTTLTQTLSGTILNKYNKEQKLGLTIKLGYAKTSDLYIIDTPGHHVYATEMLRTLDIVDVLVYVIDSTVINPSPGFHHAKANYDALVKLAASFDIPLIICINKAEVRTNQELGSLLDAYGISPMDPRVVPVSAKSKAGTRLLESLLTSTLPRQKRSPPEILGYVLKSFNVNPCGVKLSKIQGGVLGCYLYGPLSNKICHTNNFCDNLIKLDIEKKVNHLAGISTLSTTLDPTLTKNDYQKGTLILDYDLVAGYDKLPRPTQITLVMDYSDRILSKSEKVYFLLFGQILRGVVKRMYKKGRQFICTLSLDRFRRNNYIKAGYKGTIALIGKNNQLTPIGTGVIVDEP